LETLNEGTVDTAELIGVLTLPCPADTNRDGIVGAADLADLVGAWGTERVGYRELAVLLAAWGQCPPE
jgi:hypothetical protein